MYQALWKWNWIKFTLPTTITVSLAETGYRAIGSIPKIETESPDEREVSFEPSLKQSLSFAG